VPVTRQALNFGDYEDALNQAIGLPGGELGEEGTEVQSDFSLRLLDDAELFGSSGAENVSPATKDEGEPASAPPFSLLHPVRGPIPVAVRPAEPVLDHGADDHPDLLDVRVGEHQVEASHGDQDGQQQMLEAVVEE